MPVEKEQVVAEPTVGLPMVGKKKRKAEDDHEEEMLPEDSLLDFQNGGGLYDSDDSLEEDIIEPTAEDEDVVEDPVNVYIPGQPIGKDMTLVHDDSAYIMLHNLNVEWPCLSFDFLNVPSASSGYPVSAYFVGGSQAATPGQDKLYAIKVSGLDKNCTDSDDEMDEDEEEEVEQRLDYVSVPVTDCVNRVRVLPHPDSNIVACWSQDGIFSIRDFSETVRGLDAPNQASGGKTVRIDPLVKRKFAVEGYAVDWSRVKTARLACGDNNGDITMFEPGQAGSWVIGDSTRGHDGSIEDLQWSPSEADVLASAGVFSLRLIF
jgi:ribosome assembly protein RRB1